MKLGVFAVLSKMTLNPDGKLQAGLSGVYARCVPWRHHAPQDEVDNRVCVCEGALGVRFQHSNLLDRRNLFIYISIVRPPMHHPGPIGITKRDSLWKFFRDCKQWEAQITAARR